MSDAIGGFISAPIKLAAIINNRRSRRENMSSTRSDKVYLRSWSMFQMQLRSTSLVLIALLLLQTVNCADTSINHNSHQQQQQQTNHLRDQPHLATHEQQSKQHSNEQPRGRSNSLVGGHLQLDSRALRHHAHYLNIAPSTHFSYDEGRQLSGADQDRSAGNPYIDDQAAGSQVASNTHIFKRSSALISSPGTNPRYPPLVSSTHHQFGGGLVANLVADRHLSTQQTNQQPGAALIRRRMMSEGAQGRWLAPGEDSGKQHLTAELMALDASELQLQQQVATPSPERKRRDEAELLRQKQYIQYHDQWPSMAGKCHKRTLNFCASVLPFNTTTFPNIIGDTNRFEVKRSLPFFGFLAKSSCNARLDELLCLLLEPPCSADSGLAIPPCKKFCRLALEGCNEYIPATLAMSSVFDCRQYPDSSDPSVCINLAQGSNCTPDEFKCPDKTCIPRNWLCDGVRDCIFAADEANCTAPTGFGLQTSVCSTEEFKCDGKCVPKAWKCDGERDCLDGSDEESCDLRPRCGPDRFKCADGNGCLPKRWVCDGKAECRDGSDELNCEQQECSENDFKCDNGICIPKLWRCDRQFDCKDGSDERSCIYPTPSTTTTTTTLAPTTEPATMTTTTGDDSTVQYANVSLGARMSAAVAAEQQQQVLVAATDSLVAQPSEDSPILVAASQQQQAIHEPESSNNPANHYLAAESTQLVGSNLNEDVSRIIRQESSANSAAAAAAAAASVTVAASPRFSTPDIVVMESAQAKTHKHSPVISSLDESSQRQQQASKELNKFDYDIIQSSSSNLIQLGTEQMQPVDSQMHHAQQQQVMATQIDFVPQQQHSQSHSQLQQQQRQHRSGAQNHHYHVQQQPVVATTFRPLESQQQPARVPIYRSLFKSLKGGQGRFAANGLATGPQGNRLVGRRRRDRLGTSFANGKHPTMTTQVAEEVARLLHWSSSSAAPGGEQSANSSPAPHHFHNQHQNQHQQQTANQTQQARAGVASYLQLLNSRYNLRLARVAPSSTVAH